MGLKIKVEGKIGMKWHEFTLEPDNATLYYIARLLGNTANESTWILKEMEKFE